jgi:ubiquitin carboxyl-terminal hydrolase 22/27/51
VERKCDSCGKNVSMNSRPWLTALPPVLVIQLKRFEYQAAVNNFAKISDPVMFPINGLEMSPYVFEYSTSSHGSSIYDLAGIVIHIGSTDRGHYTAYAKHARSSQWYFFDDAKVTPVEAEEISSDKTAGLAYVLFYTRRMPTRPLKNGTPSESTNRLVTGQSSSSLPTTKSAPSLLSAKAVPPPIAEAVPVR